MDIESDFKILRKYFELGGDDMKDKENTIHMISNIQDSGILAYLNRFIELFLEKWGR